MPVSNAEIAETFAELADLLEIQGANPFRVRAYRNAARVVGSWATDLASLIRAGQALPRMPGIGKDLEGKIREMALSAQALGYQYLAITDHSRHLTVARGLTPGRLKKQLKQINRLNGTARGFHILKGIEVCWGNVPPTRWIGTYC